MKPIISLILLVSLGLIGKAQTTDTLKVAAGNTSLVGVLSKPSTQTNIPLALFIAGSGPTDMNGNQPGVHNNSLKFLSDELVKKNIATFRFDKRGIGKSAYAGFSEATLTFDQYIADVASVIDFCKKRGYTSIYVIGHSEGSLLGMLACVPSQIKGFISVAGAGNPADIILKTQLKPKLPPAFYNQVEPIIDSLKQGQRVKNVPPQLNILFRQSVQPYLISWFRFSPEEAMSKVNCPVLILQGDKDLQIGNDDALKLARAAKNGKLLTITNMNHVLKTITGDTPENIASYKNPELPVNPELVNAITTFILQKN